MRTITGQDVASMAASLDNDTIHAWLLDYRKESGRAPLKAVLGIYLGLPADAVVLLDDPHGRPELAAPWNSVLQFNWSHSGAKAIIALARGVKPGIDIEHIRPRPRAMELAQRFFHAEETAALRALDETQRELAFLQCWTGKEAVLKALGRGIAFGLERLHVAVTSEHARLLWLDGDEADHWQLHRLEVSTGYVACVAWRGSPRATVMGTLADHL